MKCHRCWGTGEKLNQRALGQSARTARLGRGESLIDCARRLGVSDAFLSLLESGRRSWPEPLWRKALSKP